jgi:CHAT domain-containing protein
LDASEPGIRKALPLPAQADPASAVVICTHGFFIPPRTTAQGYADPLSHCGIALAGANRSVPGLFLKLPGAENDGVLLGREIVRSPGVNGRTLIFLIACESGVGAIEGGQLASLRHAFTLGGARSVVATSWQVPVRRSLDLSDEFFKRWTVGETSYEALHNAQLQLIAQLRNNDENDRAAHPYLWAGFSTTGLYP